MQTITISITVPDGISVTVDTKEAAIAPVITAPVAGNKPSGPSLEDVKKAFLEAVKGGKKDDAFAAVGIPKGTNLKEVPAENYAAVIEKLNALVQ